MKQERGQIITRKKGVMSKRRRLGEQGEQAIYFYRKGKHAGPPRAASYLPRSGASELKDNGFSLPAACLTVSTLPWPGPTLHPQARGTAETAHTACACPSHPQERNRSLPATDFTGSQVTQTSSRYSSLMGAGRPQALSLHDNRKA